MSGKPLLKRGQTLIRPGHRVTVYRDPATRLDPEGEAVVVKVFWASDEGGGIMHHCEVQLAGDPPTRCIRDVFVPKAQDAS